MKSIVEEHANSIHYTRFDIEELLKNQDFIIQSNVWVISTELVNQKMVFR